MAKDRESVVTNGRAVFYASMWNDFRQAAMDKGWALGLHGSLNSDMDIMAMPWIKECSTVDELIKSLVACFNGKQLSIIKTKQVNNRVTYTLPIFGDFYLDINIIKCSSHI